MDVFISWSGKKSGAAAEALRDWLPQIINAVKPWLSSADIDKGARWNADIASRLELAKAGIICLTPANLHSDWILFEAGALSKSIQKTWVCPLLIDLEPAEVTGPLAQFQATRVVKGDFLRLLKTLNNALEKDALTDSHIESAFEVWWPKLDALLKALPADEDGEVHPPRTDRDVLEEILGFVRNQKRSSVPSLSDDDRKQIFASRVWKVLRTVHGPVGGTTLGPIRRPGTDGTDLEFQVTPSDINGKVLTKYVFVVPSDASPDEMEASALAQIKATDKLNQPQTNINGAQPSDLDARTAPFEAKTLL